MPYAPYMPNTRRPLPPNTGGTVRERQPHDTELADLWGSVERVAPPPASKQTWEPPKNSYPFGPLRKP